MFESTHESARSLVICYQLPRLHLPRRPTWILCQLCYSLLVRFIWDPAKATLNYAKHGVSFGDALSAFSDPAGLYLPDPGHPERGNLIGHTSNSRLLFVVHIELLTDVPPATRIISARRATSAEQAKYNAQFEPVITSRTRRKKKRPSSEPSLKPSPPKKRRRRDEE